MIAHQATTVAIGGRAVLIEGASGTGKSSLALALIDRGAVLIGDDAIMLEAVGATLLASPHPRVTGLIEVRNLGLATMPVTGAVPVALVLILDTAAPRHIETADSAERCGVSLPLIRLYPDSPVLALRAEMALARFGR